MNKYQLICESNIEHVLFLLSEFELDFNNKYIDQHYFINVSEELCSSEEG